ncbi:MAG: hypothetical protein ACJ790_01855 [Myxococcaceae bacterium]
MQFRSVLWVVVALSLSCTIETGGTKTGGTAGSSPNNSTGGSSCSQTCSGCCTSNGECLAGTSETSCGHGGGACDTCPQHQRCELAGGGGSCQPCSQLNCAGCCTTDGECRAGTAQYECGQAGQTCVSCGSGACAVQQFGGGVCQ